MDATRKGVTRLLLAAAFAAAPTSASDAAEPPPSAAPTPIFGGMRPFVGVVAANGLGLISDGDEFDPFPILLFAIRTGALLGRAEVGVEVAPFSQLWSLGPLLNAQAYAGYHLRLSDKLSWPMRAGLGTSLWIGEPLPEVRADVLGVSIQSGQWLIDLHSSTRLDVIAAEGRDRARYVVSLLLGAGFAFVP
jgi:hypothetical protein